MSSPSNTDLHEKEGSIPTVDDNATLPVVEDDLTGEHDKVEIPGGVDNAETTYQARGDEDHRDLEAPESEIIVDWEQPEDQDPANPKNWTNRRKWEIITVVSSITFITPLASSMFAPAVPQIMKDFNNDSQTDATFVVSVFVLGYALGPLIIAPMSERYGRVPVYNVCNVGFVVFTILCALAKNMGMLIAARFCGGIFGVAPITIGSGTIADIMPTEKRGRAISIWSVGPLLGPVIGPVIGGAMADSVGWRWIFWLIAIVGGVISVITFLVLRETYAPVLLERKAARIREETGNNAARSKYDERVSPAERLKRNIVRPIKMLFLSSIVLMMCVYIAVIYGELYILFTTFTFVFEGVYGFSSLESGLTFLGSGFGMFVGLFIVGTYSDRHIRSIQKSGRPIRPEDRLPPLLTLPAATFLPGGLLIYGWAADKHVFWFVPLIGTALIGFSMICIFTAIQTYLVDAFTIHAASVTAANTILRSILGALLPLCGLDMYDKLGLGWGNTLLALLALMLAPVPLVFHFFGERIRNNPKRQVRF